MDTLLFQLGGQLVRHRLPALLLSLALTALALASSAWTVATRGAPIDFTPQAIFLDDSAESREAAASVAVFGRDDNDLMLLVEGPLGTAEGIQALRALHEAWASSPDVLRVDSLASATLAVAEEGAVLSAPVLSGEDPAAMIDRAQRDPLLRRLLISEDGQLTVLRATIRPELDRVADLAPAVQRLVARAEAVPLPPGFDLHPTGVPYVRVEVVELMVQDELRFLPIVAAAFALTICLLFRRLRLGLLPLVTVLVADIWAMSLLIAGGVTFNVLSVLVPTLVLVVGMADSIHLAGRYREEIAQGHSPEVAMGHTLRHMVVACFVTCFTTATGFAALLAADTQVIRDFGLQSAIAVMVAWLAVVLLTPATLAWLPVSALGAERVIAQGAESAAFSRLDAWVRRRVPHLLLGWAALCLGAWMLGRQVQPQSSLREMYQPEMATWQALTLADQRLGGVVPIYFHLSGPPEAALHPDNLRRALELEELLRAEPAARWVASPAAVIGQLHRLLGGEGPLPDSPEAAAQELLVAQLGGANVPATLLSADASHGRVLATLSDDGGRAYLAMQQRLEEGATRIMEGSTMQWTLSGDGLLAANGMNRLISSLYQTVGLAWLAIFLTIWALLRDLKLTLLSIVPNVVPQLFTLAAMHLAGMDLQTSNIVSFTIAAGLAVDDTVHVLARYREERAAGRSAEEAVRITMTQSGHAVLFTSLLLIIGFGVMSFSTLTSTRHFGLLSAVTMTAALAAELLLMPALLHASARLEGRPAA